MMEKGESHRQQWPRGKNSENHTRFTRPPPVTVAVLTVRWRKLSSVFDIFCDFLRILLSCSFFLLCQFYHLQKPYLLKTWGTYCCVRSLRKNKTPERAIAEGQIGILFS